MKLTVSRSMRQRGFALPTVLLVSIIMIIVLVAAIGAAAGSRVALDSQYYNELARQATVSGLVRTNECLEIGGNRPQWSTASTGAALRPGTDCTGTDVIYPNYIVDTPTVRTLFSVDAPTGAKAGTNLKIIGMTELLRSTVNSDGSRDVWRRYEHTAYLRIEANETAACPEGYVAVPGNAAFNTSDFCVMKYEAKNVGGIPGSRASGRPYVNISQNTAITASQLTCSGCHLITEGEWLTIAHDIASVASNWTGGRVGSGDIYRGHTDSSPGLTLAAGTDDLDGFFGTNNSNGNQRRTHVLSNGEVIWDISGNIWEYTSGVTTGGQPGITGQGYSWREWQNLTNMGYATTPSSPLWSPAPSFANPAASTWNSSHAIGLIYSSSSDGSTRAFLRGGSYFDSFGYGIFSLALNRGPDHQGSDAGFRVVR